MPLINEITYTELAVRYDSEEALGQDLPQLRLRLERTPKTALFAAGAFARYRAAGGRTTALPDFLFGAHAAAEGLTIPTRDPRRCRAYFPAVPAITP